MIIREIRHIENLEEASAGATVQPTQLSQAEVGGSVGYCELDGGVLTHGRFSGDLRFSGRLAPSGVVLGVLLGGGKATVSGVPLTPGGLGIFPEGFDHEAEYHGGAEYLLLNTDPAEVFAAAERRGFQLSHRDLETPAFPNPPEDTAARVRGRSQEILRTLRADPGVAASPATSRAVLDEILHLFLEGWTRAESPGAGSGPAGDAHIRLVRHTEEWLRVNLDAKTNVDQLSVALGYSRRSLYRAFQDRLGVTPARYLKVYRLSQVRRALVHANPADATVTEAANDWGFWELGRFARDYRNQFGELPSRTLARPG